MTDLIIATVRKLWKQLPFENKYKEVKKRLYAVPLV